MCDPVTATVAIAAVVGTAATVYNGQQQQSAMKKANEQAKSASDKQLAIADKQAALAEEQINKANAKAPTKTPDMARSANQTGESAASTLLTGPTGVDPSQLLLGKNTLLGM